MVPTRDSKVKRYTRLHVKHCNQIGNYSKLADRSIKTYFQRVTFYKSPKLANWNKYQTKPRKLVHHTGKTWQSWQDRLDLMCSTKLKRTNLIKTKWMAFQYERIAFQYEKGPSRKSKKGQVRSGKLRRQRCTNALADKVSHYQEPCQSKGGSGQFNAL